MDDFPKVGMHFEQARGRMKENDGRPDKNNRNLFLLKQVALHEGDKAAKELAKEINKDHRG